jgi:methyl-accepting chemotaxis protein
MTISKKIGFSNAVPVFLTVVLGATALYQIGRITKAFGHVAYDSLPGVTSISQIESHFEALRGDAWESVATKDGARLASLRTQMERRKQAVNQELQGYEKTIQRPDDRELFEKMTPEIRAYFDVLEKLERVVRQGSVDAASYYTTQGDAAFAKAASP